MLSLMFRRTFALSLIFAFSRRKDFPASPPLGLQAAWRFAPADEGVVGFWGGASVAAVGADVVGGIAAAALGGEVREAAGEQVAVVEAELAGLHDQGHFFLQVSGDCAALVFLDRLLREEAAAVGAGEDAQAAVLEG